MRSTTVCGVAGCMLFEDDAPHYRVPSMSNARISCASPTGKSPVRFEDVEMERSKNFNLYGVSDRVDGKRRVTVLRDGE